MIVSAIAFDSKDNQSSFVYQTVYNGPLFTTEQEFGNNNPIDMNNAHFFHPLWLIWFPTAVLAIFFSMNTVFTVRLYLNTSNKEQANPDTSINDGSEAKSAEQESEEEKNLRRLLIHQNYYFWGTKYARCFFGVSSSWLVTTVMFIYGIRDIGHLLTLFIYHMGVFGYMCPTILAELNSHTPDLVMHSQAKEVTLTSFEKIKQIFRDATESSKLHSFDVVFMLAYFLPLMVVHLSNFLITTDEEIDQHHLVTVIVFCVYLFIFLCSFAKMYEDYLFRIKFVTNDQIINMNRVFCAMAITPIVILLLLGVLLIDGDADISMMN
jgi:hypothetical protein